MKRTLLFMLALILTVGMANAQNLKNVGKNVSSSCMTLQQAQAWGLVSAQKATAVDRDLLLFVDFNDGTFGGLSYSSTSTYPWQIVDGHEGKMLSSTNAGVSSSSSDITITFTMPEDGYINFDAICNGEGSSTYWDHCDFSIDNEIMFNHGADISGSWLNYNYELTAGAHTFFFSYTKDSSVNPSGDYFAIDNIAFGTGAACIPPTDLSVACLFTDATFSWSGVAESYTLSYRVSGATSWTIVNNITDNTYTVTGLEEDTSYEAEVFADCDNESIASTSFNTHGAIQSTAKFYAYATYSLASESWNENVISFYATNPTDVTAESSAFADNYAGTYALGFMWVINTTDNGGDLVKAPINGQGNIGTPETVVAGFESSETAVGMAFDHTTGVMYYISVDDDYILKSFDPMNPAGGVETIGVIEDGARTFAINAEGEAYCIDDNGNLCTLNLSDATTTVVGATGQSLNYVQCMAFDMETGELFWAQILDGSNYGFYYVDVESGAAAFLGQIGGTGAELTSMFMVYGETPECDETTAIEMNNITTNSAVVTWDGEAESYTLRYRVHNPDASGQTYDFEDGDPQWTLIDADGDGENWYYLTSTEGYAHSGDAMMTSASYINNQGALTPDNWLVLPQYTVNAGDAVSFWVDGQDPSYAGEHYAVYVSTTVDNDPSAFTAISDELVATGSWEQKTFDLSAYAGQSVYVAIRHFNITDMFRLNIDDVEIGTPEYGEWIVVTGITENSYTLTGLQPGTTYEVEVTSFCADVVTEFTTLPDGVEEMESNINVWNRAGEIRVELANGGNYTMNVVNILGQTVMTSNVNGMGSHIVKHNLTNGIYVVTLSNDTNSFSTKIVVK